MKEFNSNNLVIRDPIPEKDLLGGGVCFKTRPEGTVVDTIIIHSCFVPDSIIQPALEVKNELSQQSAEQAIAEWLAGKTAERETEDPNLKLKYAEKNQNLGSLALHYIIGSRHGKEGLSTYSKDGIKDMFQFYGVSAHFVIDRAGVIFEFVAPDYLAFHAGKSQMPRPEDARQGVNAFSIGIELLGTLTSGYNQEQYASLAALTRDLMARYPIKNLYGHSHIAPGRKTDPEQFDWQKYTSSLATKTDLNLPQ